jgi:hypothetical protein
MLICKRKVVRKPPDGCRLSSVGGCVFKTENPLYMYMYLYLYSLEKALGNVVVCLLVLTFNI